MNGAGYFSTLSLCLLGNILVAAPALDANSTFDELRARGFNLAYNLDHDEAIAVLKHAVAENRVRVAPDDPDSHYELGAAFGLAASYTATVEGNMIEALRSARRAYAEHEEVLDLDPSRKDANLVVGTYRYVVATLPLPLRLMAYLVGFGGGQEEGLRMIEEAAAYRSDAQTAARFALILLYNREERYADVRRVIRDLQREYPRNRLVWLEAGATALRADQPAAAEVTLNKGLVMLVRDPRPRMFGEETLWKYKRGAALVALGRPDEALADLHAALSADAHEWVRGRTVVELGKVADLAGDRK